MPYFGTMKQHYEKYFSLVECWEGDKLYLERQTVIDFPQNISTLTSLR